MKKNAETKIIAVSAKDIALGLGLPEEDASMAVCNLPVSVKEYKRLLRSKEGRRPVDVIVANLSLGAKYQGQSVGTNALFRLSFPNSVYINSGSGEPSWINLAPVRKVLEAEGVTIKGNRKVAWNERVLLRILFSNELLVDTEDFDKKTEKDFPNLPKSLRARVMDGTIKKTYLVPFYFSSRSRPRAGKGGWEEIKIDLYRLSDMLDAPQINDSRHCGPRPNGRPRGKYNRTEYGLCGTREADTTSEQTVIKTTCTGIYYVQWIGHYEDGEWVDEGSRLLLIPVEAVNRTRITYFKARLQPAVFAALSGDAFIFPNTLMPAKKSDDAAEPVNKPAQLKGPHAPVSGNGGKSNGSGDGSKATLGDILGTKGQGLPPAPPATADGKGAPAS
ncbi:MAG: hypothetical protein PHC53_00100 [Patescibacteria group bacterium]|nr:hypothetical protein [Patescibacteria group bacterium]